MPRVSGLTSFGQCPGFAVLRATGPRDVSGQAAQNGSALGRAAEVWHRLGEGAAAVAEALDQVRHESSSNFPAYDEEQVRKWFEPYCADPRNATGVISEWQERELTCTLEPAPDDPTGRPIVLVGHVDQIRRTEHGGLRVWDLKTSQGGGAQLVNEHAWQLAAYAVGATQSWGEGDVLPGGIIRVRGYTARPRKVDGQTVPWQLGEHPVFWPANWSLEQCYEILDTVRAHVSLIRQGVTLCNPGRYCGFCPGVSPAVCGQHLAQIPDTTFLEFADGKDTPSE